MLLIREAGAGFTYTFQDTVNAIAQAETGIMYPWEDTYVPS